MRNLQNSLGFITNNNSYNTLTEKQKIELELLNNDKTILGYLTIKINYKYWSNERITKEINDLKNK